MQNHSEDTEHDSDMSVAEQPATNNTNQVENSQNADSTPKTEDSSDQNMQMSDNGTNVDRLQPSQTTSAASIIEDLEVEIRSVPTTQTESRDLAADLLKLIRQNLERATPPAAEQVLTMVRENLTGDYLDPDFWRGMGMVLQYQLEETRGLIERHLSGDYTTDPFGMDMEIIEAVRPFMAFLYNSWWRVSTEGLDYVPENSRALMVSNHSGTLPWDGAMIATAVMEEHPQPRVVRSLHLSWFSTLPIVAPTLATLGQVQGLPENAIRLLNEDELVCVFPEGLKGVGKLFKDRYQLARFGRGGFIQMALRTGSPIIPVAVIGAEEIYPMLANAKPIARLIGFPYFPITPFFPWLGLLGTIPLPSKWTIVFHEPIETEIYGTKAADNPLLVAELAERVRTIIQGTLKEKTKERKSIFFG